MKNTWGLGAKMDVLKDLETKTEQQLHDITISTYQVRQISFSFASNGKFEGVLTVPFALDH